MKYAGPDTVNGVPCDQWVYSSGGDVYSLWATTATVEDTSELYDVLVANGKVSSTMGNSLWMTFYYDFVPPMSSTLPWRAAVVQNQRPRNQHLRAMVCLWYVATHLPLSCL
jgi:hypothetical protein